MTTGRTIALIIALLMTMAPVFAADPGDPVAASETAQAAATAAEAGKPTTADVATLATVTVIGKTENPLTVSATLGRATIDALPQKNGSINEVVGILPGVQLGDGHRTSDNAGEILPPDLAISGGRIYENNFTIDGFSNNSLLDPANRDIDNFSDVPGHPQQSFLHPGLVEKITVYRSNIPARYGSFTGGVVEVETRDPSGVFGAEASLRHTRSEWTSLHEHPDRAEEYHTTRAGSVQPRFRKFNGSLLLDIPVTEQTGVLAGYTQIHSKIPLYHIQSPDYALEEKHQYRTIENFFLKAVTHPGHATKWSVTGTYSPYEAEYFRDKVLDGDYTLENLAYSLTSKLEHRTDRAEIEFGLAYGFGANRREAPNQYFNWQVTDAKPWGAVTDAGARFPYSREGSYGDVEKAQHTFSTSIDVVFDPIGGTLQHNVSVGVRIEQADGSYDRTEEFTNHTLAAKTSAVVCAETAPDCISGEQFMTNKTVYPEDRADVRIRFYDAYAEDRITYGKVSFRPGLRVSRDDLQDQTNLAPRLAAGYDLWGDGSTNLYAGYNRYYGKTLMTHALAEEKTASTNWRRSTVLVGNRPQPWTLVPRTTIAATQLSDLETPHSDERTIGLDQKLFNGLLTLNYLERDGENELAITVLEKDPDTGYQYTEWTNDGRSEHKEASISWERQWLKHALYLALTWQETETSNSRYTERADFPDKNSDGAADPVWYNGSLIERSELPRPDFNRDLVGSLVYTAKLPHGLTFTNVTSYRSGYQALENTGTDRILDSGMAYDIYDEVNQPESWLFDWALEWRRHLSSNHWWALTLEINNVFNEKVPAGSADDIYQLGRQFWLGMTYKF